MDLDTKKIVAWLLVVGGVNWGVVGLTGGTDLVASLLGGNSSLLVRGVFVAVGLAALYKAYMLTMAKK